MTESTSALSAWESFYVIVGSSGGALIGLQFVVITLIAANRHRTRAEALGAFGTPTVVHLAGALVLSAIMSAPWPSLSTLAVALGACSLGGLAYDAIVIRRAMRQTEYAPVREDWVWYVVMPVIFHAVLAVTAVSLCADPPHVSFAIASVALGLLLVGIRNAWDTVVHIVVTSSDDEPPKSA